MADSQLIRPLRRRGRMKLGGSITDRAIDEGWLYLAGIKKVFTSELMG